jgi:hypothetical protein
LSSFVAVADRFGTELQALQAQHLKVGSAPFRLPATRGRFSCSDAAFGGRRRQRLTL